jgi:hypothetical protein
MATYITKTVVGPIQLIMLECERKKGEEARFDEWRVMGRRGMPALQGPFGATTKAGHGGTKNDDVLRKTLPSLNGAGANASGGNRQGEVTVVRFSPDGKVRGYGCSSGDTSCGAMGSSAQA